MPWGDDLPIDVAANQLCQEPRVIRRRMKEYDLMTRPRAHLKAELVARVGA